MIDTLSMLTYRSLRGDYERVAGLGEQVPIVLTAKAEAGGSYRRERYRKQRATILAGKVFKEMRQSLPGFIRFGRLGSLLRGEDSHPLNQSSIEPYDFESLGNLGIFVFHDDTRIRLVNLATGEVEDELREVHHRGRKMELYNVHTVQLNPHDPDLLLISVTGLDRVIELRLSTREVTWEWCPWHHGLHTNGHGLTIVDEGDPAPTVSGLPDRLKARHLTAEEAETLVNENRMPPPDERWIHQVKLSGLPARLGLEKWERVKLINSAHYSPAGDKILITFWQTGEAVSVDRSSGALDYVARGLGGCPHSLIPFGGGYLLTDTRAARVLRFDAGLRPVEGIDFSECPLPVGVEEDSPEWLQNTLPIAEDLLATIDFRRNRVVVWNPSEKVYSEYPVSDEWVVQSLKRIPLSSRAALGLED